MDCFAVLAMTGLRAELAEFSSFWNKRSVVFCVYFNSFRTALLLFSVFARVTASKSIISGGNIHFGFCKLAVDVMQCIIKPVVLCQNLVYNVLTTSGKTKLRQSLIKKLRSREGARTPTRAHRDVNSSPVNTEYSATPAGTVYNIRTISTTNTSINTRY